MLFQPTRESDAPKPADDAFDGSKVYLVQCTNSESVLLEQYNCEASGEVLLKVIDNRSCELFAPIFTHTARYANVRGSVVRKLLGQPRDHKYTIEEMRDRFVVITAGRLADFPLVVDPVQPPTLSIGYHFNFGAHGLGRHNARLDVSQQFGSICDISTLLRTADSLYQPQLAI